MDQSYGDPRQEIKRRDHNYVDLKKLNDALVHDPFPTPFTDEVLDNVGGQEVYSFTDGFLGYHQIRIHEEYRHKLLLPQNGDLSNIQSCPLA